MQGAAALSVLLTVVLTACFSFVSRASRNDYAGPLLVVTIIAASIVLPRLLVLAQFDSSMFNGLESRYLMPGTVLIWIWISLILGSALVLLSRAKPIWKSLTPVGDSSVHHP
jgi:uncharacterized membrane protein YhaH (DUF805 family)